MKSVYLHINSRDEFLRIDIYRIVYFEADGNYTKIILSNNLHAVVCMNLGQMQQFLNNSLKEQATIFARIGKKHIINYSYVYQISVLKHKLILSDGANFSYQLSVSKNALKSLKEMYVSTYEDHDAKES